MKNPSNLGFHDRYVNNRILECLSRPQYVYSCGLTSLTCVVNFLWSHKLGIITQEVLARQLGFDAKRSGEESPGNRTILDWFRKFRAIYHLSGTEDMLLDRESFPALNSVGYEKMVVNVKRTVRSKDTILIHHTANHYNIVCGYFEAAEKPDEAYKKDVFVKRWLLLAEHYDGNNEGPIDSIRFRDLRKALRDKDYGVLRFSSKGEKEDWAPRHM